MKSFFFLILFGCCSLFCNAQPDSCQLRISLLTCSPGAELYASWGHTAIRVQDPSIGMDMVFNYGTFDDTDPQFLTKFVRGIMLYSLSAYPFSEFMREYQFYRRGVEEQVLRMSCTDKTTLFEALKRNVQPGNQEYQYYFKEDNCTTRARDIIAANISDSLSYPSLFKKEQPTYRNLIHHYLDTAGQHWNKLGIDLLLGSRLDQKPTNKEAMFLPDNLMKAFAGAKLGQNMLVLQTNTLLPIPATENAGGPKPLLILALAALLFALPAWLKLPRLQQLADRVLFLTTGLLGILLLTLWLIRTDDVCRDNLNLVWALPTHFAAAFLLGRKNKVLRLYLTGTALLNIALLLAWIWLPQQLNTALLPIILLLTWRALQRSKG